MQRQIRKAKQTFYFFVESKFLLHLNAAMSKLLTNKSIRKQKIILIFAAELN
jgi:hypothetical protein